MEWLGDFLSRIFEGVKWFFILQPWESAIRVRSGKKVRKYTGGMHFRIPYIDYVFSQNCRVRISPVPAQTLTTLDGKTITLKGALRYYVEDVELLYTKLHMAEETVAQEAQAILSEFVPISDFDDCAPRHLRELVNNELDLKQFGLGGAKFLLTDYAVVKTYRFITGEMDDYMGNSLQTDKADE
jgi:hypothetical protein